MKKRISTTSLYYSIFYMPILLQVCQLICSDPKKDEHLFGELMKLLPVNAQRWPKNFMTILDSLEKLLISQSEKDVLLIVHLEGKDYLRCNTSAFKSLLKPFIKQLLVRFREIKIKLFLKNFKSRDGKILDHNFFTEYDNAFKDLLAKNILIK